MCLIGLGADSGVTVMARSYDSNCWIVGLGSRRGLGLELGVWTNDATARVRSEENGHNDEGKGYC